MLSKVPRTSMQWLVTSVMCVASTITFANEEVWGEGASVVHEEKAPATQVQTSNAGVALGQAVTFRGVGTVFYAGRSGGDVYFAAEDQDNPTFRWEDAVRDCLNKGPGWMLPSIDQLNLLFRGKDEMNLGATTVRIGSGSWYWSSTTLSEDTAMKIRFSDGVSKDTKRHFTARTRCVRSY